MEDKHQNTKRLSGDQFHISEDQLRSLFKSIPIPAYAWQRKSDDFILVDYNAAAKSFTGDKVAGLLRLKASELYQDEPQIVIEMRRCFQEQSPITREMDVNLKSTGGRKCLNVKYVFVPPDLVIVLTEDLTKHKQEERQLQQSEENWKFYLESSPDGIYISDLKGTFQYGNKSAEKLTGYTKEELLGKSFLELHLLRTKDLVTASKLLALSVMGKPTGPDELKLVRKNGSYVFVEINTKPIKIGGKTRVIGFVRDITERKKAEEELKESKDLVDAVVENVPLMIFLKEAKDLRFVIFNHAGEELLGYDRGKLLGKNNLDLFPPDQADHFMANDREVLDGEEGVLDIPEEPIMTAKKGQLLLHTRKVVIRGADGTTKYLLGISEDITERKQREAENQLLRDKAEISSRLSAVGEMAAGIAHEINNPLTAVIGFSELLMTEDLPQGIKDELKIIADGGKRVKDIVRRMLTFARQTEAMKSCANINELIKATLDLRSYVLNTANIEVVMRLDPDLPIISADSGQLQQVFLNLIVNAEYSMKKAHDKGILTITTQKKDDYINISFNDDGMGMSKETKEKIFNPFFTTKEVNEGTGLGLSLSRSIILDHRGTIEVESEPGKGATFIIDLPINQPSEEGEIKTRSTAQIPTGNVRAAHILVVDDEEAIRKLVSTILAKSGHTVETTGDARKALVKMDGTSYDAVLMDIRMPGMSGIELYNKVKPRRPELAGRFIFITGDTSDENTMKFLEKNELSYITKPFDKQTLIQKVNSIL